MRHQNSIQRELIFKDFMSAVHFIRRLAVLAEKRNHHPDIHLTQYRHLKIELSTHSAGGLTDNDFALATDIDALFHHTRL